MSPMNRGWSPIGGAVVEGDGGGIVSIVGKDDLKVGRSGIQDWPPIGHPGLGLKYW